MIKIAVPDMTTKVVDRAIQAHGGMGVCQDTPKKQSSGFMVVLLELPMDQTRCICINWEET